MFARQIILLVALAASAEGLQMLANNFNKAQLKANQLMQQADALATGDINASGATFLKALNQRLIPTYEAVSQMHDIEGRRFFGAQRVSDFQTSFANKIATLTEKKQDGSSSGSDFIMNNDWVFKTESEAFVKNLVNISDNYCQHMGNNPASTIANYVMVVYVNKKYWTVMRNINTRPTTNIQRFDLKVSRPEKKAHQENFTAEENQLGFLGDWMMDYEDIEFENEVDQIQLLGQLERDLDFFTANWGIAPLVDYSLFVIIMDRPQNFDQLQMQGAWNVRWGIPVKAPIYGKKLLKVGIIDILAPVGYNSLAGFGKALQTTKQMFFKEWTVAEGEGRFTENYAANLFKLAVAVFNPATSKASTVPEVVAMRKRMNEYKETAEKKMKKNVITKDGQKVSQNEVYQMNQLNRYEGIAEMLAQNPFGHRGQKQTAQNDDLDVMEFFRQQQQERAQNSFFDELAAQNGVEGAKFQRKRR